MKQFIKMGFGLAIGWYLGSCVTALLDNMTQTWKAKVLNDFDKSVEELKKTLQENKQ